MEIAFENRPFTKKNYVTRFESPAVTCLILEGISLVAPHLCPEIPPGNPQNGDDQSHLSTGGPSPAEEIIHLDKMSTKFGPNFLFVGTRRLYIIRERTSKIRPNKERREVSVGDCGAVLSWKRRRESGDNFANTVIIPEEDEKTFNAPRDYDGNAATVAVRNCGDKIGVHLNFFLEIYSILMFSFS
ncbi:hypothetical protein GWI33_012668 [Rhynchophorus ferrugineus]|uniref:Uncharacterized protein n=1 Tax=Rhynchophorus ferrugineus TaxID=354439 RepID=A0A834IB82_RHYFE|nr:hypothetical protein GWI33_012668 [Rhynchophorus ferrugineus]